MFEHRSQPLLPRGAFVKRLFIAFACTLTIMGVSLFTGMTGYHWFGKLPWGEAFHHTCLMLSGHDVQPVGDTVGGHIFSGLFVLYARLVFVTLVAILLIPVLHRILHKIHLAPDQFGNPDDT